MSFIPSAVLIILIFHITTQAQTNPDRPNIMVIIADDLGLDPLQGYLEGGIKANTPNLNQLAERGITFTNAWTPPQCAPTRAAMISGKIGAKTGVIEVPGELTTDHSSIFNELRTRTNDAYANAVLGKWQIGVRGNSNHPADHGVDHYDGVVIGSVDSYFDWEKTTNGETSRESQYVTSYLTDQAINWVNQQTQPWFLWLAHIAPHAPFHTPPSELFTSPASDQQTRYIAMIEALDTEIGRLFDNIPSEVLDNTVILFIGDNGTPNGVLQTYPNRRGKSSMYQGGVHVPMIVAGAGVTRQNVQENKMVNSIDFYATILEIAGTDLPGGIHNSLSFKHLLDNTDGPTRPYNYAEIEGDWTIRNEQYKVIQFADGTQEFYDLMADPLEDNNLINNLTAEQEAIKAELEAEGITTREDWSCNDFILNGDEVTIDDCGTNGGDMGTTDDGMDDMTTSMTTCAVPSQLSIMPSESPRRIQIEWEGSDNVTQYNLQIRFKGSTTWVIDATVRSSIVSIRGPFSIYEYRVRAVCSNGETSEFSEIQEFTLSRNLVSSSSRNNPDSAIPELTIPTQEIRIFPNPVSHFLQLEQSLSQDAAIKIYDAYGQVVLNRTIKRQTGTNSINVRQLASGVYFLSVQEKGEISTTLKFIKE